MANKNSTKHEHEDLPRSPLLQPDENVLTVRYSPDERREVIENPPRFQWIPPQIGRHSYELQLQRLSVSGQPEGKPTYFTGIAFPFFTPAEPVEPGSYSWRYRTVSDARGPSDWSQSRRFIVPADAIVAPVAFDRKRAAGIRPRLAIAADGHKALISRLDEMPAWAAFVERSVLSWVEKDIPAEPEAYPNNLRTAELWRRSYITCQEALYGIRNLAVAGVLQRDAKLTARAKDWLLAVAQWDPEGPTSRSYNDEAAFRCATALAWGYDWLRTELSPDEADAVRSALKARGEQVARHVMHASRIDSFPYDSHAVRAVSAVMVPVGLALAGEDAEGTEWLDFAANYLAGPYSAWADEEGGWAEGIHYWTTAMCYALEAATLLRNATGLNVFDRPFFRNTGNFPLYCRPAWTRRGTFGDDSTLGDAPSPKIARNMRLLAAATGTPEFAGYADQIETLSDSDESAFYNYGWWDFRFDDLLREASFGPVDAASMPPEPRIKLFPGVGWTSLQSRMDDPDHQIHCVFKSSPFGSISHSHADQNAFCLSAFGDDILVQSGHYIAHNSSMHRKWRRQTLSKNALLIDGQGQYADVDKFLARQASGAIVAHGDRENHQWAVGDATDAYRQMIPDLLRAERQLHMIFGCAFVVIDHVAASRSVPVSWFGHTLGQVETGDRSATIDTAHAMTGIEVVYSSGSVEGLSVIGGFDDVDAAEVEGLETSRRLSIDLAPAKSHVLATLILPVRKQETPKVMCFVEDQGFGRILYCVRQRFDPVCVPLAPQPG
ncbi:heparinase II/III domain-containing protein [Tropicimonas aquimaris]|uniref:Heparinase II/III family protein n=1 Tax=Tropicimonas aquimaris TaxID=914152 RepID=A0ABW3INT3_9RHOB